MHCAKLNILEKIIKDKPMVTIYNIAFFHYHEMRVREMGTPEARNLISVRCDFTTPVYICIYLLLEGGGEISVRWVPLRPEIQ